jgi:hypothetical protein
MGNRIGGREGKRIPLVRGMRNGATGMRKGVMGIGMAVMGAAPTGRVTPGRVTTGGTETGRLTAGAGREKQEPAPLQVSLLRRALQRRAERARSAE